MNVNGREKEHEQIEKVNLIKCSSAKIQGENGRQDNGPKNIEFPSRLDLHVIFPTTKSPGSSLYPYRRSVAYCQPRRI